MAAAASVLCACPLPAQRLRSFTTFRQWHSEPRLSAKLEYAAGTIRLSAGRPAELYRMEVSYDEDRFLPVSDFEASTETLALGLRPSGDGGIRVVSRRQLHQTAVVAFSPRVDLSLDVTLGAVDADLELGGLRITDLVVATGASQAVVRFSHPNGVRCRAATFRSGAAELSVLGLGNSRCDLIVVEGGVGTVTLDLGGPWTSNARVRATMAMGALTLRLPRNAGVSLRTETFLSSVEPSGMERRGARYFSRGYDQAARHVDIELTSAVGGITIEWVE